jgi:pSer/pThr/pTyr-binding forkhead associated (FHA) protein
MSGIVVLILRILLAVLLYSFLGWALVTLWRDLRIQGQLLSKPHIPPLTISGPDENGARAYDIPEVIIGRSSKSDYPIPNDTVSARHARLSFHHNQWWVQDMNSMNGTYLNDERISVATVIVSGDELRCGKVSLSLDIEER